MSEHSESAVQVVALVTEGAQRPELPAPADLPGTGTFAGYSEYIMLMEQCWDQDPAARPTFAQVCISAPNAAAADVLQPVLHPMYMLMHVSLLFRPQCYLAGKAS